MSGLPMQHLRTDAYVAEPGFPLAAQAITGGTGSQLDEVQKGDDVTLHVIFGLAIRVEKP